MAHKMMVCIHGHFYQPPRENPWLEDLEREPSAAPHHNWNSRIAEECYTPNAWARVLDKDGKVARLYDNYGKMSFNVGPTLASWLARHVPETLDAMVRADAASAARLGQGNAIAQVYNHAIMPLCNRRDKQTQVRWGKRAFEATFGRAPRGMWLAETAVDADTMEALAQHGIDFTILSPFQAARFRVDGASGGAGAWRDCGDGSIPTGRAYRYVTKSGKSVAVFFYDGGIAKGIAFERLLADATHLIDALKRAHAARPDPHEPWLVHTATDGESYGHHFRFGDMALAAAHARLDDDPDVEVVNYATFLDRYGARGEVELHAVSAWSCAHGVGRWERDCGCRMNPDPRWTQRWRSGLRQALNGLRDGLSPIFEYAGSALFKDPWGARDAYIDVVIDGSLDPATIDAFFARHAAAELGPDERRRALTLLELQRCALLMFTSCGWFFDDISGPEAVILLRYAARALGLARAIDASDAERLEAAFLEDLSRAESNVRRPDGRVRTGRDIYLEDAKAVAVTAHRVAVSLALTCATGAPAPARIAIWRVTDHDEQAVDSATVPCVVGTVSLVDCRVERAERLAFGVVGFGGLDWRGVLVPAERAADLLRRLSDADGATALARVLDGEAASGARTFTLKDAPSDLRDAIVGRALERRLDVTDAVLAELLLADRGVLRGVTGLGAALPTPARALIAHALSRRVKDIVRELLAAEGSSASFMRRLRTICRDAVEFGVTLEVDESVRAAEGACAGIVVRLLGDTADGGERAGALSTLPERAARAVRLCEVLGMLAPEKPLLRLLKAGSGLSSAAVHDARLAGVASLLLPRINEVCRSAFAVPKAPDVSA